MGYHFSALTLLVRQQATAYKNMLQLSPKSLGDPPNMEYHEKRRLVDPKPRIHSKSNLKNHSFQSASNDPQ